MTRTIKKTVFNFDELSERAKDNARNWWRNGESIDFSDTVDFDDFAACAKILGIDISTHSVKLMNGSFRYEPNIYWSGFGSQDDGASFEGYYHYTKGAAKKIRAHAPNDTVLSGIADRLQAIQRKAFYRLSAAIDRSGRYSHSYAARCYVKSNGYDVNESASELIAGEMQAFADWIFAQLRADYEYRMSDDNVDESIRINDYDFDADGAIA